MTLTALPRLPRPSRRPRPGATVLPGAVALVAAAVLHAGSLPPLRAQPAAEPAAGPAGSVYRRGPAPPAPPPPPPTASPAPATVPGLPAAGLPAAEGEPRDAQQAERIVAAALAGLGRADSISARLRQRVRIGDRVLVGAGRYVQSGQGEDQRYRLESAMKSDTETFEVLEVCDGLFAWSYRRLGPLPAQFVRLVVRRVRVRLRALAVADDASISPHLGGLQRTLALVRDWFRFTTVDPAAIDDMPVWVVVGRWNPDALAAILPDRADAAYASALSNLPKTLPGSRRESDSSTTCSIAVARSPGGSMTRPP